MDQIWVIRLLGFVVTFFFFWKWKHQNLQGIYSTGHIHKMRSPRKKKITISISFQFQFIAKIYASFCGKNQFVAVALTARVLTERKYILKII